MMLHFVDAVYVLYDDANCMMQTKQDACNVGDEGGFAPNIQSNIEGIELLMKVS
jgi:enolase